MTLPPLEVEIREAIAPFLTGGPVTEALCNQIRRAVQTVVDRHAPLAMVYVAESPTPAMRPGEARLDINLLIVCEYPVG